MSSGAPYVASPVSVSTSTSSRIQRSATSDLPNFLLGVVNVGRIPTSPNHLYYVEGVIFIISRVNLDHLHRGHGIDEDCLCKQKKH
jgi:hypothetical protein